MGETPRPRFLDSRAYTGRRPDALGAGALDDLAALGVRGGIAAAIASSLHDCQRGNRQLQQELASYPGWRPCWTLGMEVSGPGAAAQVREARSAGAAAVACHPRTQDFALQEFVPAWPLLEAAQIPVLLDRPEVDWAELDRLAAAHPRLPIIISSLGYRELRRLAPFLQKHQNVLLDTVNFSTHCGIDWFVEQFGAERLLFATGAPLRDPGEAITQLLWSGLTAEQIDLVSHGNAERLFDLEAADGPSTATPREDSFAGDVLARRPSTRRIVDIHAHAGPYSLFHIPNPEPRHMVTVMDRCGVDLAVLSTNRAIQEDSHLGNDETLEAVDAFPDRFRGYGVVNPWQDPESELERIIADPRFLGIKLHPDLHRYPLTGSRYRAVWEFSARTGCPVLTHTWYGSPYDTPNLLRDVAAEHGAITAILGHSGAIPPGFEESAEVAADVPGTHLEICGSAMNRAYLRMLIEKVGSERILFGSDFPFIDQRVSLGRVAFADLTPHESEGILATNANALLGWRPGETVPRERPDHHG